MKKLYVTDLDGTLLNKNEGISQKSIDTINELISKGADITIATARSPVSASKYTSKLNLKLPILCYNGEIIYDTVKKSIIRSFSFDNQTKENILRPIFMEGYRPFIHTYDKNEESHVYHYDIKSDGEKWYYNARMNDPMDKRFRQEGA